MLDTSQKMREREKSVQLFCSDLHLAFDVKFVTWDPGGEIKAGPHAGWYLRQMWSAQARRHVLRKGARAPPTWPLT